MTNRSKAKGTAAETALVNYLRNYWPNVERRALHGTNDRGDIAGIPGVVIEVKNHRGDSLPGWVDELLVEMRNDRAPLGAVIHKRYRKSDPAEWFATMPVWLFVKLLTVANVEQCETICLEHCQGPCGGI